MGVQKADDIVIAVGIGGEPEGYESVGGLLARAVVLSARLVETTTAQSPQAWRELMAGAGTKRIEIAGRGWFWNGTADERMRAAFFAGVALRFKLDVFGFGVFEGPFAIAELSYGGESKDVTTFSIRLASAGAISFTPE